MSEETVGAASSAADDVFGGQEPTMEEYNSFRHSGELPARFKPAETVESATTDAQEKTESAEGEEPETEPESDPEEAQEQPSKPLSGAEKRIKQLLAKTKELEAQLAKQDVKQEVKAESSTAQATRNKPTAEDKTADGKPKYETYEDFVEDLADWKAEQRIETVKREQAQQEAMKALNSTLEEARARYEDADDVIFPAAKTISEAKIPRAVKEVFEGSDLFVDLCYVVGSDQDELKKFIKLAETNPRAAIGKVFDYERGIKEELGKTKDGGKAPEPKKTSAPKPPSPVNGASSRAFDVSDESLSPEEWMRKRNAQVSRRG